MIVVMGVKKSEGVYNDRPYSNFVFYFADTDDTNRLAGTIPLVKGNSVIQYKVKTAEYDLPEQPIDYIGREVNLYFDRYGNVSDMRIV